MCSTAEAKIISQETPCEKKSVFLAQVGVSSSEELIWETRQSIGFL